MNIGIVDAIKVLKGGNPKGTLEQIAIKNKCTVPELENAARKRAVALMLYALPNRPDTCREEDGKIHMYCPNCENDITCFEEDWDFCPYCGQAVTMPEEEEE